MILSIGAALVSGQPSRRFQREAETYITCSNVDLLWPRWSGRMFLSIERNRSQAPVICTDKDGVSSRVSFEVPEAAEIIVDGVAAGVDGEIVVAGTATSSDSHMGTFVARIAPDKKETKVTRVWPYVPRGITVAADGSIWTVGWLANETNTKILRNYVLKRFDRDGKNIATIAPQIRSGGDGTINTNLAVLRSSSDRIGLLTDRGHNEYVEFALDGREIARFEGPPLTDKHSLMVTYALSGDNQAIAASLGPQRWDVWSLDRDAGAWRPIEVTDGTLPAFGTIIGFDQNTLIVSAKEGRTLRFQRSSGEKKY